MASRRIRPGEGWELALGELLTYLGWSWQHTQAARVPGRRAPITPMRGPAASGWPDFTAYRLEGHRGAARFLVAEAKSGEHARLEPHQRARLEELDHAGIEAYRFREQDLDKVQHVLEHVHAHPYLGLFEPALTPWRVRPSARFRVALSGRA